MEAAGALVQTNVMNSMEDAARELNKLTVGCPTCGLQWNVFETVMFHIWKRRNQRRMQAKSDTMQQILRRIIEMTTIIFDDARFKKKCKDAKEQRALLQWDALVMLIYDGEVK